MITNLVKVREALGDRVGRDIFFYSITLQPEADTPEVLQKYREQYRVKGPGWLFLTGKPEDIELLRRKLGFTDPDDPARDANKSQHIGVIRFGNEPYNWWAACPALSSPNEIVKELLWLYPPKTDANREAPVHE